MREVFDKVGGFDDRLGRTEDNDIHQRIIAAGYKNLYDKDILSYKYVRPSWKHILIQKFSNGYWIGKTTFINPACISFYYYVPAVFVVMLFLVIMLYLLGMALPLYTLAILYGGLQIVMAGLSVITHKNPAYFFVALICLSVHLAYGVGTLKRFLAKNKELS